MQNHYSIKLYPMGGGGYRMFSLYWWKHILNPKHYYRGIKYFCQRGYRGYADCDHWDADSYLEHVMLGVLKDLKEHTHGYPQSMSDYDICHMSSEDDIPDTGAEKWKALLTEIIEGLEASLELRYEDTIPDGIYSDEPFEFEDVPGKEGILFQLKPTTTPRFNAEKYNEWAEPLRAKKIRAMYLLRKHWGSFWD